jgi:hypothetical protein
LSKLFVGLDQKVEQLAKLGNGPTLGGALPQRSTERSAMGEWFHKDPAVEIRYSGGLLLGSGFSQELYVHVGFHPAWKYHRVHELLFESGRLTKAVDRSEFLNQVRERMGARPLRPENPGDRKEVEPWIDKMFPQDYHW